MSIKEDTDKIVRDHVVWSMAGGLVPIPFADIAVVSAVQLDMLSQLSSTYGIKFSVLDAKSLVTALMGGGVARLGAELVKLVPGVGTIIGGLSMAVLSGASTYAVAQVAINEFAANRDLSSVDLDAAKDMYKRAFEQGKQYASDLEKNQKAQESASVFDQLERLAMLKEQGLLTDEEFKLQKQKLLERL